MKIKTSELSGRALDAAVEMALGNKIKVKTWRELTDALDPIKDADDIAYYRQRGTVRLSYVDKISGAVFPARGFSSDWAQGGPIIERANITIIRADDDFEVDAQGFTTRKRIPQWFAHCDQWTGHSTTTSYEGEHMAPTFMIGEEGGYYGTTPLIAAMRCFVTHKLGGEVNVPDELVNVEDEASCRSPRERGG